MSAIIAYQLIITGRVQGVGYRDCMVEQAKSLGVAGWVRNLTTGEVQAHVEGEPVRLEQLIKWCERGPSFAVVTSVQRALIEPCGALDFARAPTALISSATSL
jgi:acylphosphatase